VTPSNERPIVVVLRPGEPPGEALRSLLSHPVVRQHWMPPLWALDRAGIDLPAALPDVTSITLGTLPRVVDTLMRLATKEVLDRRVRELWRSVDEQVRHFYLRRGLRQTLATMFRVGPRTLDVAPPPAFVVDRVHESAFEVQYRIEPKPEPTNVLAPEHEATVVLYPFRPVLEPDAEPSLEVFAYDEGRARHRAALEDVARTTGWRVRDEE
jgi:hypothetical protein